MINPLSANPIKWSNTRKQFILWDESFKNVRERSDTSQICMIFYSCKIYEKLVNIGYVRYTEKICSFSDVHCNVDSAVPVW